MHEDGQIRHCASLLLTSLPFFPRKLNEHWKVSAGQGKPEPEGTHSLIDYLFMPSYLHPLLSLSFPFLLAPPSPFSPHHPLPFPFPASPTADVSNPPPPPQTALSSARQHASPNPAPSKDYRRPACASTSSSSHPLGARGLSPVL